jgi:hypothetical protein
LDLPTYRADSRTLTSLDRWLADPNPDTTFATQLELLVDVVDRQEQAARTGGIVERCLFDTFEVFAKLRCDRGEISPDGVWFLSDYYAIHRARIQPPVAAVLLDAELSGPHKTGGPSHTLEVDREEVWRRYRTCIDRWDYCKPIRIELTDESNLRTLVDVLAPEIRNPS